MNKPLSSGLHANLRKLAQRRAVTLSELKPNTMLIAERMIANGELIKTNGGYVYHDAKKA